MEILLKYRQRGFELSENSTDGHKYLSHGIMTLINEYTERNPKWTSIKIGDKRNTTTFENIWQPTILGTGAALGYGNFHIRHLSRSRDILKESLSDDNDLLMDFGLVESSKKYSVSSRKKYSKGRTGLITS